MSAINIQRKRSIGGVSSAAVGLSFIAFFAALPALAGEISAKSRIDAVVVYPDAAQISRVAVVEIPKGSTSLVFKNLPLQIDPNSLRVQASGDHQLTIGSVAARIAPASKPSIPASITAKLRGLINERNLLSQTIRAYRAKKAMIQRFAKAGPERMGDKSGPMKVEDWDKAWNAVGNGLAKVAEEEQAARMRMRELAQEIRTIHASNRGSGSGSRPRRTVVVDVEAPAQSKVRFVLTYRVSGARWQPVYDARLATGGTSGKPALELIRRASVTQRTGEDWSGVKLSVSTVQARRGTHAPNLLAQLLDFYKPPRPIPMALERKRYRRADKPRYKARRPGGFLRSNRRALGQAAAAPAVPAKATIDAGPYETQFTIPGRIDLKADGSSRILYIASSKIAPQLGVKATPALDQTAYLEAVFVNKGEAPLLPGIVNIHRDGIYVGQGRVKLVAPGEKVTLGFGSDNSVKIKRVPVNRTKSGPGWIGNNKTEIVDYTISVKNLHSFPVNVRIVDRIPIAEDSKIVIKALPTNTLASEKNVDGKRGVMAWAFTLKPDGSKNIRVGWQVEWPKDKRITKRNIKN